MIKKVPLWKLILTSKEDCPVCTFPIKDHKTPPTIKTAGDKQVFTCLVNTVLQVKGRRSHGVLKSEKL